MPGFNSALAGTCAALLAVPSATSAQVTTAGDVTAEQRIRPPVEDPSITIADIVVTAQKQSQSVNRVPAAITAVDGTELSRLGIANAQQLGQVVSSVELNADRDSLQITLRGIGTTNDQPQTNPGVATNLDGIYQPRQATTASFFDLERVEVLKGPQGTLYGRSASGGLINVITAEPAQQLQATGNLEVGNYNQVHVTGTANVPITDTLTVRGAVDYNRHDGFLTNGYDDLDSLAGRLRVLFQPSDAVRLLVTGAYYQNGGRGVGSVLYPYTDSSNPFYAPSPTTFPDSSYQNHVYNTELYADLQIKVLPGVTLTYLPSYLWHTTRELAPLSGLALGYDGPERQTSHELRLGSSEPHRLQWQVGMYYYWDHQRVANYSILTIPGVKTLQNYTFYGVEQDSIAGFGQATYTLLSKLRLTGGLRYSRDHERGLGYSQAFNQLTSPPAPLSVPAPTDFDHVWTNVDYKAGVEYDLASRTLLYANVATGYKPGGYTAANYGPTGALVPAAEYKPEHLTSYSLGIKARLFGGRLQVNDEAFYYNYSDFQLSAVDLITRITTFFNANKVRVYGNDLDLTLQLTSADRFNVSLGLLHTEDVDFVVNGVSLAGFRLPRSPDVTVTAGYEHSFDLNSARLVLGAHTTYHSGEEFYYNHLAGSYRGPYTTTDANLTYHPKHENWSVGLYVRNIENAAIADQISVPAPPGQNATGFTFLSPPRTFGGRLSFRL